MGFLFGLLLLITFLIGLGVYTSYFKPEGISKLSGTQVKTEDGNKESTPTSTKPKPEVKEQDKEAEKKHENAKTKNHQKNFRSFLTSSAESYKKGNSEYEIMMLHELEKARKEKNINRLIEIFPY